MLKKNIERAFRLIFLGAIIYCGVTLFHECILDEIEDLIYDVCHATEDSCCFDLDDLMLGTTMLASCIGTTYSLLENLIKDLFKKENKDSK